MRMIAHLLSERLQTNFFIVIMINDQFLSSPLPNPAHQILSMRRFPSISDENKSRWYLRDLEDVKTRSRKDFDKSLFFLRALYYQFHANKLLLGDLWLVRAIANATRPQSFLSSLRFQERKFSASIEFLHSKVASEDNLFAFDSARLEVTISLTFIQSDNWQRAAISELDCIDAIIRKNVNVCRCIFPFKVN